MYIFTFSFVSAFEGRYTHLPVDKISQFVLQQSILGLWWRLCLHSEKSRKVSFPVNVKVALWYLPAHLSREGSISKIYISGILSNPFDFLRAGGYTLVSERIQEIRLNSGNTGNCSDYPNFNFDNEIAT